MAVLRLEVLLLVSKLLDSSLPSEYIRVEELNHIQELLRFLLAIEILHVLLKQPRVLVERLGVLEFVLVAAFNRLQVHDVRVRETLSGLVVNYHCRADQSLTVDQVHEAVDKLDRRARLAEPAISRIVGHAEPAGH
jgi:hypothetical protein